MNTAKHMRAVLESRRTCATCPEMDNPDSYIGHLQSALKWHDEHVPRPTNPSATCVVLQGERLPEEVLFVREDGEVTHYLPERTCERTYHPNRSRASGPQLTCSECGYGASDDRWAFCPKCGARYENTCQEAIRAVSE